MRTSEHAICLSYKMGAAMRKIRFRLRFKIFPVLWSIIIMVSVYLLIRFAIISFSEDMGQAGFGKALVSKLCAHVIESGSSSVSYAARGEDTDYTFPLSFAVRELAIEQFAKADTVPDDIIKEYANQFISNDLTVMNTDDSVENTTDTSIEGLGVYEIETNTFGMEYILTNGAIIRSNTSGVLLGDKNLITNQLQIGYLKGDIIQVEVSDEKEAVVETAVTIDKVEYTMEQLKDINFLVRNFYVVDASTEITESLFNAEKLLSKDMTLKQGNEAPQILIYHTHSSEAYIDSRPGKVEDTVVGVGEYLATILKDDFGYNVIHNTSVYDIVDGKKTHDAYNVAEDGLNKILDENPSIEVVIDLHRDSPDARNVTIDGKETAQIMLFNGLSRDQKGPITYLDNPNLQDNLAFSLQLQLKSLDMYPGLFIRNYLKAYRYNMHVRAKSILMELGTNDNTIDSARNAMYPFAEVLDSVLKGE